MPKSKKKTKRKTTPSKKIVHQIYGIFDDGIPLKDIPVFYENVQKTKAFCKKHKIQHKMWNLQKCNQLIKTHFQSYQKLWNDFTVPIQRADFIRYCILYHYGGIYVDCDIHPIHKIDHLFKKDYFFVSWADDKKKLPYNAVMGSKKKQEIFLQVMDHSKESFYEKKKQKIYQKWKGRFVFQTTGHYMLNRVLKQCKVNKKEYVLNIMKIHSKSGKIIQGPKPLFEDSNASVWYDDK